MYVPGEGDTVLGCVARLIFQSIFGFGVGAGDNVGEGFRAVRSRFKVFCWACFGCFSSLVGFAVGEPAGVAVAAGEGADVGGAEGEADGMGSILRGLNRWAWDLNWPRLGDS